MNKEIYEIFRACRLCGVGAGYKMPIIQSVVEFKTEDIPLQHKIKECVQIEVNFQDTMPPLICELCVDKIQDFYEFRRMCHETNKKTRHKLGLPLQAVRNESILGVTESLYSDTDDGQPLAKRNVKKKPAPRSVKMKKEIDALSKFETSSYEGRSRSSSVEVADGRASVLKRVTRHNRTDETLVSGLVDDPITKPPRSRPAPKSAKRNQESDNESIDDNSLLRPMKRTREVPIETPPSAKKTKTLMEPPKTERTPKPGPKSSKEPAKATPPQRPPPKTGPKSKKLEVTARSQTFDISKSKNLEFSLRSKKVEPQNAVSSKSKSDLTKSKTEMTKPGPKSKKVETSPAALKSKKVETLQTPVPKGKKHEPSPGPKSKRLREPSPKPEGAAHGQLECDICQMKIKSHQGLVSHIKVHTVTFTPPELACNACELWFPNGNAAALHKRKHTIMGLAYTCSKCYDDFRTAADYDMHFTRNQCIATYEVPDVKCEECWKTFPTYKLLEDHRCPGEGGRPGGKCAKCKRVYASLKGLRTHEFRCTLKKKVEPPSVGPVSPQPQQGMLPMQVCIVRCDKLLTIPDGRCDVSGLSHRFGLDRNSTYPYLYSMGSIKPESSASFDHMVAINDEIKQEYLKTADTDDEFVHWDSDDSDNSDMDTASPKSVLSLSNISLKTLFSPKCLGKVPKKKKDKTKTFDSVLSVGFNVDLKTNISSLIDSLGNESIHSGDYDSDSILDKNVTKKVNSGNVSDSLEENVNNDVGNTETDEKTVQNDKPSEQIGENNNSDDKLSNVEELKHAESSNDTQTDNNDRSTSLSQEASKEVNKHAKEVVETVTRIEGNNLELPQIATEDFEHIESSKSSKETEGSQNNISSPKSGHLVSNDTVSESETLPVNNNVANTTSAIELENRDAEMTERKIDEPIAHNNTNLNGSDTDSQLSEINEPNDVSCMKRIESDRGTELDVRINDNGNLNVTNDKELENDEVASLTKEIGDTQDLPSINDAANGHDSSCPINNNDHDRESHEINENITDDSSNVKDETNNVDKPNTEIVTNADFISKDDEVNKTNDTIENFAETMIANNDLYSSNNVQNVEKFDMNDLYEEKEDEVNKETDTSKNDNSGESLITENDLFGAKEVENVDKFNINNLDEEDKLLMAELDAQIGENLETDINNDNQSQEDNFGEKRDTFGNNSQNSQFSKEYSTNDFEEDKNATLDALINKKDDLKSLDLDSISDEEFNFDI